MVHVIEQGTIRTIDDICRLRIIDWNRLNDDFENNQARAMRLVTNWLMNHANYTIAHVPLCRRLACGVRLPRMETGRPTGGAGKTLLE